MVAGSPAMIWTCQMYCHWGETTKLSCVIHLHKTENFIIKDEDYTRRAECF